jgi:hypothetical protein
MSLYPEMHFRGGVDLRQMSPQTLYAWQCASVCCQEAGVKCEATSLYRPGLFAKMGFHSNGNAIDIGMAGVPLDIAQRIWDRLEKWIGRSGGGQFDVVNELRAGSSEGWTGPHIHIEFDPK